jgi:serine/threonine protein kinase
LLPRLERTDLAEDFENESTILKNYSPSIFTSSAPLPFHSVQEIGRGAQGAVDEVRLTSNNTTCVRKTWIKQVSLQAAESRFLDELKILYRLRKGHHFIQYVSSYILDLEGQEGEGEEREDDTAAPSTRKVKLVEFGLLHLPRAICDLENLLGMAPQQRRDIISDAALMKAMGCLIIALHSMHQSSVRHRDVKPANILVHDRSLIFTDFGLSRDFFELSSTTESHRVGTVLYWSPELQAGKRRGTKADVFALGCVFFEIMFTLIHSTSSSEVDIASFRPYYDIGNLSRVQEWADDAKKSPENSTLVFFWLHACQRMLGRYPDLRVAASSVLQKLCERKNEDPELASDICCDFCSMEYTAGLGLEELNKLEFDDGPWTEGIDFLLCRKGPLPEANPGPSNGM